MQYAFNKPMYGTLTRVNPMGVTFYVSNTTNPGDEQGSPGPSRQGRTPANPFNTIAAAITAAVSGRGDTIIIQRGTYSENLTVNRAGLTLMGAVPYGYPDHVVIQGFTNVTASGVSFYNIEFFSNSTTRASVDVGLSGATTFAEANGSWFENCSFASDGTTEPAFGLAIYGGNNHTIKGCYFIDNTRALALVGGSDSWPSHIVVEDCQFLENTTYDIGNGGTSLGGGGGVRNLIMRRNTFGAGEVTPTDTINISGTSSGIIADNDMGRATNDAATITIPAGILYTANRTEAGSSTARPV